MNTGTDGNKRGSLIAIIVAAVIIVSAGVGFTVLKNQDVPLLQETERDAVETPNTYLEGEDTQEEPITEVETPVVPEEDTSTPETANTPPISSEVTPEDEPVISEETAPLEEPVAPWPAAEIIEAETEYLEELESFLKKEGNLLEDYADYFGEDGFTADHQLGSAFYYEFENKLDELKEAHDTYRDEAFDHEEDSEKRAELANKYPEPNEETYSTIPALDDYWSDDFQMYSLDKLSETGDYDAFFSFYGHNNFNSKKSSYMAGLSDAMTPEITSRIQCDSLGDIYGQKGCHTYFDATEAEATYNIITQLLSS